MLFCAREATTRAPEDLCTKESAIGVPEINHFSLTPRYAVAGAGLNTSEGAAVDISLFTGLVLPVPNSGTTR
jgi:hypothetical protein